MIALLKLIFIFSIPLAIGIFIGHSLTQNTALPPEIHALKLTQYGSGDVTMLGRGISASMPPQDFEDMVLFMDKFVKTRLKK